MTDHNDSQELDDRLLADLRSTVGRLDPVPPRLVDSAKAAYAWRTIDEELARLEFDSLAAAGADAGVRSEGTAEAVRLSFAVGDTAIEVDVRGGTLIGQVVPPATAVRVLFHTGDQVEVRCDEFGQFTIEQPVSGPIRIVAVYDGRDVATEWFNLP